MHKPGGLWGKKVFCLIFAVVKKTFVSWLVFIFTIIYSQVFVVVTPDSGTFVLFI